MRPVDRWGGGQRKLGRTRNSMRLKPFANDENFAGKGRREGKQGGQLARAGIFNNEKKGRGGAARRCLRVSATDGRPKRELAHRAIKGTRPYSRSNWRSSQDRKGRNEANRVSSNRTSEGEVLRRGGLRGETLEGKMSRGEEIRKRWGAKCPSRRKKTLYGGFQERMCPMTSLHQGGSWMEIEEEEGGIGEEERYEDLS